MSREGQALVESASRAADWFGDRFASRVTLACDRHRAPELAIEARPVIEALLQGLRGLREDSAAALRGEDRRELVSPDGTRPAGPPIDPRANELREAVALASLLGRRAGILELTPTAVLEIVPALLDAVRREGYAEAEQLASTLTAVSLEGYVAARDERLEERASRRAADAVPIIELVPQCFAFFPAGLQSPEELERLADEVGRRLLERNAVACLVHAGALSRPDRERAASLLGLHSAGQMLGVQCIFSGLDEGWRRAAEEAHLDLTGVRLEPTLSAGLHAALHACGYELRRRPALGGVFRRLLRPSQSSE